MTLQIRFCPLILCQVFSASMATFKTTVVSIITRHFSSLFVVQSGWMVENRPVRRILSAISKQTMCHSSLLLVMYDIKYGYNCYDIVSIMPASLHC